MVTLDITHGLIWDVPTFNKIGNKMLTLRRLTLWYNVNLQYHKILLSAIRNTKSTETPT